MRVAAVVVLLVVGVPPAGVRADPPNGAAIYTKRCAGCHGDDGKANTRNGKKYSIADFTSRGWSKDWPPAAIEKNVRKGIDGKMPGFAEKLSGPEIAAVSLRVLELAGSPVTTAQTK